MPDHSELINDFQGLPMKDLIGDPLVASANSQRDLAQTTLNFLNEFAFEPQEEGKPLRARMIEAEYDRLVVGRDEPLKQKIKVPAISMVTIPNLSIQDVEIGFTMEVKAHTSSLDENGNTKTSSSETGASVEAGGGFMGVKFSAKVEHKRSTTGTVTSKSTNTRSTDFSAKYDVKVSAKQNPPAEGMGRFTQLLANVMEPIDLDKDGNQTAVSTPVTPPATPATPPAGG